MSSPQTNPTSGHEHNIATVTEEAEGQAIHLPREFHIEGELVRLRHVDGGILLETPVPPRRRTSEEIAAMFKYIDSLGADDLFPEGRNQGIVEERLPID